MTKIQMSLEWLASKSEAEQRLLLSDDGYEFSGWQHGYPAVSAEEAEALRNGKPYPLSHFDIERMMDAAEQYGCNGNPDTDPFIIKALAKGFLVENPTYTTEVAGVEVKKTALAAQYGGSPDRYGIGVGISAYRWIATEAGKEFARSL